MADPQNPLDELLEIVQLKVVVPAEGLFSVQIIAEEGVACPEALVQGVGEGAIPIVLEPIIAVQVGVSLHIADKAALVVFFCQIFFVRRLVAPILCEPFQLRGVTHDEGAHKIGRASCRERV